MPWLLLMSARNYNPEKVNLLTGSPSSLYLLDVSARASLMNCIFAASVIYRDFPVLLLYRNSTAKIHFGIVFQNGIVALKDHRIGRDSGSYFYFTFLIAENSLSNCSLIGSTGALLFCACITRGLTKIKKGTSLRICYRVYGL